MLGQAVEVWNSPNELCQIDNNTRNLINNILLTKKTTAKDEVALSYDRVRGLYFLAVVFAEYIFLTKTTTTQNEDALSYLRVRGLCFLAVVFVAAIVLLLFLIFTFA